MHNNEDNLPSTDMPAEEAEMLSNIYAFLALTMRYPDHTFCNDQFIDALVSLLESLDMQQEISAISEWRDNCTNLLDDLQLEYTRLFINSAPRATIPPYASVYMDGDGTIQGKSTEKIKDFYRSCGYEIANSAEPPDHIQHQLEFLAAIVGEAQYEQEDVFLNSLFRPWFERFYDRMMNEARHPFFRVSIQLIDFFTKEEQ